MAILGRNYGKKRVVIWEVKEGGPAKKLADFIGSSVDGVAVMLGGINNLVNATACAIR